MKCGMAHMYHVCHAFKEKQRQSSSTDADDPESLWKRHCADSDFCQQGETPKCRYEVFILKQDAIDAGSSQDLWSREVEHVDPHTQQTYKVREDFGYAITCRELLDIIPIWIRAADGQDVNLPVNMMSYVKVPITAELGAVFHRALLTPSGYRSVLKHGFKKGFSGRARVFADPFWKTVEEWPWSLTGQGSTFTCPDTGRVVSLDVPYGHMLDRTPPQGQKLYWYMIDWRVQKEDQGDGLLHKLCMRRPSQIYYRFGDRQ